jgi:hypothetical protein
MYLSDKIFSANKFRFNGCVYERRAEACYRTCGCCNETWVIPEKIFKAMRKQCEKQIALEDGAVSIALTRRLVVCRG